MYFYNHTVPGVSTDLADYEEKKYHYPDNNLDAVPFSRQCIEMVRGQNWLDDEGIMLGMRLMQEESKTTKSIPVICHDSQLLPKYEKDGDINERWVSKLIQTRKITYIDSTVHFFPLNERDLHWSLAMVLFERSEKADIKDHFTLRNSVDYRIIFMDSFGQPMEKFLPFARAVARKLITSCGQDVGSEKDVYTVKYNQTNTYDCGMYVCLYTMLVLPILMKEKKMLKLSQNALTPDMPSISTHRQMICEKIKAFVKREDDNEVLALSAGKS